MSERAEQHLGIVRFELNIATRKNFELPPLAEGVSVLCALLKERMSMRDMRRN